MADIRIDGLTEKATPVNGDLIVIDDSQDVVSTVKQSKKVDVSKFIKPADVVNDLVSTDTDKPLSANQGKTLKDELDELETKTTGLYENAIINSGFNVDQYGLLPITGITIGEYIIDRWTGGDSGIDADAQINLSSTPSGLAGGINTLGLTATSTSASGELTLLQKIEDVNFEEMKGLEFTFSCWVKSNNLNARLRFNEGSGNDYSTKISSSGVWERLSYTKTIDASTTTFIIGCTLGESDPITVTSGDYIEICAPKLELGSTATPYKPRHYGEELALCQRYYFAKTIGTGLIGFGKIYSSTRADVGISFPVTMRIAPSAVISTVSSGYNVEQNVGVSSSIDGSVYTFGDTNSNGGNLVFTGLSGFTAGSAVEIYATNSSCYVAFNAEL